MIDRRRFLRGVLSGAAVSVALPLLDASLDGNGVALADGSPLPKRFGVFFWGNGVRLDKWNPSKTGSGSAWDLSEELAPLADVKDYVSVVSGMNIMTGNERGHHAGCVGILSGCPMIPQDPKGAGFASTFGGKSIDQVIAAQIGKSSRFKSLEVAVSHSIVDGEGTTLRYMSHNGPDDPNPAELEPKKLFERVFGMGFEDPAVKKKQDLKVGLRRSVLDAVTKEANVLAGRVGATDRIRLQAHLDGIRTLEKRLASMPPMVGACAKPTAPGGFSEPGGQEALEDRARAYSDLIALVFACDVSRVFTMQFSGSVNGTVFWEVGATKGHHELSHDEAGDQPTVHAATVFTMKQFAYLLQKLKDTSEGAGNLLDRSAILASSDTSHGREHSIDDYPVVVAGKAGGALKGNVHHRAPGENTSKVLLSMVRACGISASEFGKGGGRVTESCTAIEGA